MSHCPCCSGKNYADCCEKFIDNQQLPETPEELMRSRYTAYTQANIAYIADTMKSPASDNFDPDDARKWAQLAVWNKLEVLQSSTDKDKGFVEFIAHFSESGTPYQLHELSEFRRDNGKWFYITGQIKSP